MTEKKKRKTISNPPRLTSWARDDGSEHLVIVEWEAGGGILCRGASKDDADEAARLHIQNAKELVVRKERVLEARLEGLAKAREARK